MRNTGKSCCVVLLSLGLLACSSNSTMQRSYIDPQIEEYADRKGVLVVAVTQQQASREDFEEVFVRAFERRGISAVASYTLVPGKEAEAEDVIAAAKGAELDTILVTRYVGERVEEVYHPGTIYYDVMPTYSPYGYGRYGRFGGYYGHAYEVAYEQPVWSANRTYTVISDLFTTDGRDHLWQAISDTIKSGSEAKLRDDIVGGFIRDMNGYGLLN